MSSASQLNDKQLEAMKYVQGPLLVLAGAGSGKTSVITRKVAYLVQQCGIPAYRITAMTFTNKAARFRILILNWLMLINTAQIYNCHVVMCRYTS